MFSNFNITSFPGTSHAQRYEIDDMEVDDDVKFHSFSRLPDIAVS
jgi:hypothetical protein